MLNNRKMAKQMLVEKDYIAHKRDVNIDSAKQQLKEVCPLLV